MKKVPDSKVTWHDARNATDVTFELYTEKGKWYVKNLLTEKLVNKDNPLDSRPSVTKILEVAGAKGAGY